MNSNTNQKINQVTEKTLVIGIDIAKRTHITHARLMREDACSKNRSLSLNQGKVSMLFVKDYLFYVLHMKKRSVSRFRADWSLLDESRCLS